MKRYVYVLCLLISLVSINACKKESDPEPEPVVGSWKLDRVRTSGFVAPYTSLNKDNDPAAVFGVQDSFVIKNDKTFNGTYRNLDTGEIDDYDGNWDFANNTLTLKDTQGNSFPYTLDAAKTPAQLVGETVSTRGAFTNPNTSKVDTVAYKIQSVYVKQ